MAMIQDEKAEAQAALAAIIPEEEQVCTRVCVCVLHASCKSQYAAGV